MYKYGFIIYLLTAVLVLHAAPSIVTVDGYQLKVDGQIFFVRGVNWSPVPKGSTSQDFNQFVDQDLPLIRAAGMNCIRIWGWPDEAILDKCVNNDLYVILQPYLAPNNDYTGMVNQFKDHPAVLMWQVGNEFNYNHLYTREWDDIGYATALQYVKNVVNDIHSLDANHPVIVGYGEIPPQTEINTVDCDLWGLNVYSGISFYDRFSTYKSRSSKPFIMTEYGADAWDSDLPGENLLAQSNADYQLTMELIDHSSKINSADCCAGGTIFSWSDGWHKAGNPWSHDSDGNAPGGGPYPDFTFNEEYWGIVTIERTLRPAYYALKSLFSQFKTIDFYSPVTATNNGPVMLYVSSPTNINSPGLNVSLPGGGNTDLGAALVSDGHNGYEASYNGFSADGTYTFTFSGTTNSHTFNLELEIGFVTTAPGVPSDLTAAGVSTGIKLNWTASSSSDPDITYEIWYAVNSSAAGDFSLLETTGSTSYNHMGLTRGNRYYYKIKARDSLGNESVFSAVADAAMVNFDLEVSHSVFAPVSGETVDISFKLPFDKECELYILNINGARVKRFIDKKVMSYGSYSYQWQGRGNGGQLLPAGVYYVVGAVTGEDEKIKNIILQ
ncbi:MAG TPA: glycoside hydrolase family 2 TIM barrel-domain containing protein [Spirochaetota bacterium]|nr:glycoside hydrolase family 2 TIM barrel-domain containing protein [Spirochaetota bacterium]